jgi:ribosomal protein S14
MKLIKILVDKIPNNCKECGSKNVKLNIKINKLDYKAEVECQDCGEKDSVY